MKTPLQIRFEDPAVAAVFQNYSPKLRRKLLELRALIFETAKDTVGAGCLKETLKWGQPSYLTEGPKTGTTIRISQTKIEGHYALYVNCQTTLIADFEALFPTELNYEGKRAVVFRESEPLPAEQLTHCIRLALTYHRRR